MKNKPVIVIARIAVYAVIALLLFIIESLFPPIIPIAPFAKIGLANIVTLLAIVTLGHWEAGVVLGVRCLLGALYSLNPFSLMYSLSGGIATYAVMCLLYRFLCPRISLLSVSVAGAIAHNLAQAFVAVLLMNSVNFVLLLPLMLPLGVIAGLTTGAACLLLVKFLPQKLFFATPADVDMEVFESE